MASFTLRFDTAASERAIRRLRERAPFAEARAINRAAASAVTLMIRVISQDTGVKQADLRGTSKRNRAIWTSQAVPGRPVATIYANTERIPLYDFQARQTKRGVTAKLGPARKVYPHLFIATMPSGHPGVWGRTSKKRLPIVERFGPSIARVWTKHSAEALARAQEQLLKNMQHEFRFALSQGAPVAQE